MNPIYVTETPGTFRLSFDYNPRLIEVIKRKGSKAGTQSDEQKSWQELVERNGSVYVVCHGIIEFITAVCRYIHVSPAPYIEEALNKYPLYR